MHMPCKLGGKAKQTQMHQNFHHPRLPISHRRGSIPDNKADRVTAILPPVSCFPRRTSNRMAVYRNTVLVYTLFSHRTTAAPHFIVAMQFPFPPSVVFLLGCRAIKYCECRQLPSCTFRQSKPLLCFNTFPDTSDIDHSS